MNLWIFNHYAVTPKLPGGTRHYGLGRELVKRGHNVNVKDLPLYRYGISLNKLFDYLAASKQLILACSPSNDPVEETHCGLTVPPRAPKALAEAVIKLYKMPQEEREAMGKRGREYVEKYHSIPKLAERLIQCLEGVL